MTLAADVADAAAVGFTNTNRRNEMTPYTTALADLADATAAAADATAAAVAAARIAVAAAVAAAVTPSQVSAACIPLYHLITADATAADVADAAANAAADAADAAADRS